MDRTLCARYHLNSYEKTYALFPVTRDDAYGYCEFTARAPELLHKPFHSGLLSTVRSLSVT